MKKFKFRLEALENIKGMELDALRQAFAAAQAELWKTEGELIVARDTLDATYNELAELRIAQAEPLILLSLESYTGVLREQIRGLRQRITEQRQQLKEAQERVAEKHKEKKVLEKYRERKFIEYNANLEREIQQELDEIAQNMHHPEERI